MNRLRDLVLKVQAACNDPKREKRMRNPFRDYAGQGRTHWRYGCAHTILDSIEKNYIASPGRGWLRSGETARTKLVSGDSESIPLAL